MIIAIDFDGTIVNDAYPAIGAPMVGVKKALDEFREDGHYIIVWTCRADIPLLNAVNWLLEHDIPFDRVNAQQPEHLNKFGGSDTRKLYADVYIDDRNLGGFPGWYEAMEIVKKMTSAVDNLYEGCWP